MGIAVLLGFCLFCFVFTQNAGLQSTDYARHAINNIKVSNVGSYRHHVPSSTQLW